MSIPFEISALQARYRDGSLTPTAVIEEAYRRIAEHWEDPVWITLLPREEALARARELESKPEHAKLPLYGIPFAVKDNIDVANLPTTAGCPAYSYQPRQTATVVAKLLDAGAILIGKTNMDQFATGLVGVRSPYGACSSVYNRKYISGGSSSGSGVAVARRFVSFSLGTDTAGSGRVPAAFNNIIGLKPTRGVLSAAGVVPACRSLDCVSIFALNCRDAEAVWQASRGLDASDAYSRQAKTGEDAQPWVYGPFRYGVPKADQLEFFGDEDATRLYGEALSKLEVIGGLKIEIDLAPFRAAAELLYAGPWVAERLAAIRPFLEQHGDKMNEVVRGIISGGMRYSAVDAFQATYKLEELRRVAHAEIAKVDFLALPTTGTIYTHEAVQAEPVQLNTNLGYYTNFVNLLDLAAVSVPAGFRPNGLPFGISLIGSAFSDQALLAAGGRFLDEQATHAAPPGSVLCAVVGAHLSGQPLNWQLTQRRARLTRACRTAGCYRLYALANTQPPKPGLVRDDAFPGRGIEVEVWAVPEDQFGGFVAAVPPPLTIGNAQLETGEWVKCFLCEPQAMASAREITELGGWRNYLAAVQ